MTWSLLRDLPDRELECTPNEYQPLRNLVASLRHQPYAGRVHAHWSHMTFVIGTAASYKASREPSYTDVLSIEFEPHTGLFIVGHGEPGERWGQGKVNGCWTRVGRWAYCLPDQVGRIVDDIVCRRESAE